MEVNLFYLGADPRRLTRKTRAATYKGWQQARPIREDIDKYFDLKTKGKGQKAKDKRLKAKDKRLKAKG